MGKLCYLRPWLLYHRRASAAIIQNSFLLLDRKLGHYLTGDDAVSSKAYSAIATSWVLPEHTSPFHEKSLVT